MLSLARNEHNGERGLHVAYHAMGNLVGKGDKIDLPALILRVLASFVNSKTIYQLLSEKAQTALPPQWQ